MNRIILHRRRSVLAKSAEKFAVANVEELFLTLSFPARTSPGIQIRGAACPRRKIKRQAAFVFPPSFLFSFWDAGVNIYAHYRSRNYGRGKEFLRWNACPTSPRVELTARCYMHRRRSRRRLQIRHARTPRDSRIDQRKMNYSRAERNAG